MTCHVSPEYILTQRALGWPDIHPEDYCHRCGNRNTSWHVDRESWLIATEAWGAETGREGICCVTCFTEMHKAATGKEVNWELGHVPIDVQRIVDRAIRAERDRIVFALMSSASQLGNGQAAAVLEEVARAVREAGE